MTAMGTFNGILANDPTQVHIEVTRVPDAYEAVATFQGRTIGIVRGLLAEDGPDQEPSIDPEGSSVAAEWRGLGIGVRLYEALYERACSDGINWVTGWGHSHAAGRVHESLARRHGYAYEPEYEADADRGPYWYNISSACKRK